MPAFRAGEGAGLGAGGVANLATGAGYGAVSEGADRKTLGAVAEGGAVGGLLGAGGGYLIDKAAPVVAGLFRRWGLTRRRMRNAATMTPPSAVSTMAANPKQNSHSIVTI